MLPCIETWGYNKNFIMNIIQEHRISLNFSETFINKLIKNKVLEGKS